jgi:hypothetical protein
MFPGAASGAELSGWDVLSIRFDSFWAKPWAGHASKKPCQSVAYGDCIGRAPGGKKTASILCRVPEKEGNMSDENNPVKNPKANEQELSPKELEGVSGGSLSLNFTKIEVTYTQQDGHTDPKPSTNS